jgi:hypothetical protein
MYYDANSFRFTKRINSNLEVNLFKWYEVGVLGLGLQSTPYLKFDQYFTDAPWSQMDLELQEIFKGRRGKNNMMPGHACMIPEHINNKKWLNYYIYHAEKYLPKELLDTVTNKGVLHDWIYKNNLAVPDWSDRLLISMNATSPADWYLKHVNGKIHEQFAKQAPVFANWLRTKVQHVFKDIGRVIVFQNVKDNPVGIHRDHYALSKGMKLHSVNFQFGPTNRPFFVYDEVTTERHYVSNMRAYSFNDLDLHGVDAEDEYLYTVRIDGVFTDNVCKEMGLVDGYTWGPLSSSYKKLDTLRIFNPE